MIRRLRARHLRITVVLAFVVPAILLAALLARHPVPTQAIPAVLLHP